MSPRSLVGWYLFARSQSGRLEFLSSMFVLYHVRPAAFVGSKRRRLLFVNTTTYHHVVLYNSRKGCRVSSLLYCTAPSLFGAVVSTSRSNSPAQAAPCIVFRLLILQVLFSGLLFPPTNIVQPCCCVVHLCNINLRRLLTALSVQRSVSILDRPCSCFVCAVLLIMFVFIF